MIIKYQVVVKFVLHVPQTKDQIQTIRRARIVQPVQDHYQVQLPVQHVLPVSTRMLQAMDVNHVLLVPLRIH
jgi:hypothetical protein